MRLEAVGTISSLHVPAVGDALLDVLADPVPAVRAAALRSLAAFDPENFIFVLSGLDPDPHWNVRAALATVLGTLPLENGLPRLEAMLNDADQRVIPFAIAALVKLKAPAAASVLIDRLKSEDPVVRAAAAEGVGELKPANGAAALAEAYRFGQRDSITTRAAALAALEQYGPAAALPVLQSALADKDLAVRVRAAQLVKRLDPNGVGGDIDASIRPAPTTVAPDLYSAARLVSPPFSTQVYLETDRGMIQIELAVNDAPLTAENFITLARTGYFDGIRFHRVLPDFVIQDGDPRGDGEGWAGLLDRDELNQRPYLRGTVGMALDPGPTPAAASASSRIRRSRIVDAKYTGLRPGHRRHGRGRPDSAVGCDSNRAGLGRPDDEPLSARALSYPRITRITPILTGRHPAARRSRACVRTNRVSTSPLRPVTHAHTVRFSPRPAASRPAAGCRVSGRRARKTHPSAGSICESA